MKAVTQKSLSFLNIKQLLQNYEATRTGNEDENKNSRKMPEIMITK